MYNSYISFGFIIFACFVHRLCLELSCYHGGMAAMFPPVGIKFPFSDTTQNPDVSTTVSTTSSTNNGR